VKLTVITTIYNALPYLEESLESVFNQTFKDFELILVNDGSTDGSRGMMYKCLDKPNVRMLENENNEGIPISRNRALLEAQGEYIAIHDGDDVSLPDRFQKEIEYLDSHPEIDFMGTHALKIGVSGGPSGYMSYPPPSTEMAFGLIKRFKLNPIIDPSCMYRKRVVLDMGGYTMDPFLRTALDFHLWCRLLSKGSLLYNIQEPLIKYRINPEGVTRTHNNQMIEATDSIIATFNRHNFKEQVLRKGFFRQDSFTEIRKDNIGENE